MNYSNFLTVRELTVLIKYNLENDVILLGSKENPYYYLNINTLS